MFIGPLRTHLNRRLLSPSFPWHLHSGETQDYDEIALEGPLKMAMPVPPAPSAVTLARQRERAGRRPWRTAVLAALMSGMALGLPTWATAGQDIEPPTQDEAVAAFAVHASLILDKMGMMGTGDATAAGQRRYGDMMGKVNVFAARKQLGTCNQRPRPDETFMAADAPRPPVLFDCRWSTGERVSFTRLSTTGAWMVSDQATTAEGMGMVYAGPRQASTVTAIAVTPPKEVERAPEATVAAAQAPALALAPQGGKPFLTPKDLPSPYVGTGTLSAPAPTQTKSADPGPMPTPFR